MIYGKIMASKIIFLHIHQHTDDALWKFETRNSVFSRHIRHDILIEELQH